MGIFSNRRQTEETTERENLNAPNPAQSSLPSQPIGFETVLGANSVLDGKLNSTGNVRLDGTFTGTLDITGNILVGETAKITANIDARNISIAGAVRGNVTGNKVQILRTGRVWGDIMAKALTMEEGAFIDGKITMAGHVAHKTDLDKPADEITEEDATISAVESVPDDEPTEETTEETTTDTDDTIN